MPINPTGVINPTVSSAFLNKEVQIFSDNPIYRASAKSWAYYKMLAYKPEFQVFMNPLFFEWDVTKLGPRPLCLPISKIIIDSSAAFLFSQNPRFTIPGNKELEGVLNEICDDNSIYNRLIPMARQNGNEGSIFLKFAFTPSFQNRKVSIISYSPWEVEQHRDPLDQDNIFDITLRIKYKEDNLWKMIQEVWTNDKYIRYMPLITREKDDNLIKSQLINKEWPIDKQSKNPFGLMPFVQIYNRKYNMDTMGVGDLYESFESLDQLAITWWLEHRSNQLDGNPITAIVDAVNAPDNLQPGTIAKLTSSMSHTASISRVTPGNNLRKDMEIYANNLERMILDCVGADRINFEEVTNTGKMSKTVLETLLTRSINTTLEKRSHWGRDGMEPFFANMLLGLSRIPEAKEIYPALSSIIENNKETYNVIIIWPEIVKATPDERTSTIADVIAAVSNNLLTQEKGIEIVANLYSIEDVETLKNNLLAKDNFDDISTPSQETQNKMDISV